MPSIYPLQFSNPYRDSLHRRELGALKDFTDWLSREGVGGFIGEVSFPNNLYRSYSDEAEWATLDEAWYKAADQANLWVTFWTVQDQTSTSAFWLNPYAHHDDRSRELDTKLAQAPITGSNY